MTGINLASRTLQFRLLALGVGLLAFMVYINTLSHEFVWDDQILIVKNPLIKSPIHLGKNLVGDVWQNVDNVDPRKYYRPVITLSYFFDYQLWRLNPLGYHLTNVLVHTINSVLVFILAALWLNSLLAAILAGALFALHPIHTESVAWISGRTDLFCVLFLLISLLSYYRGLKTAAVLKSPFYWLGIAAFGLALLAKETAVIFPLLLILLDYFYPQTEQEKTIWQRKEYYAFWGILILYLAVRFLYIKLSIPAPEAFPWYKLPLLFLYIYGYYFYLLFFPWRLNAHYDLQSDHWFTTPLPFLTIFGLLVFGYLAYAKRRMYKELAFLALWVVIGIVPVLNLGNFGDVLLAERFLYLPSLAFCLFLGAVVKYLWSIKPGHLKLKVSLAALCLLLLFGFGYRTYTRNFDWQDNLKLFTKMEESSPRSVLVHSWRAYSLAAVGRHDEALNEFKTALQYGTPTRASFYYNMGLTEIKLNHFKEAAASSKMALELNPDYSRAYLNLGIASYQLGNYQEALAAYKKSLQLEPDNAGLYNNIGLVAGELNDYQAAETAFRQAITLAPEEPMAYLNLANLNYRMNNLDAARKQYQQILELFPQYPKAGAIRDLLDQMK